MPYEFYKVIHLVSVFAVMMGLGGISLHMIAGGERKFVGKRWAMLFHGIGLALVLISGFGLMARIGLVGGGWPAWITGKLIVWLSLGAVAALILRAKSLSRVWWVLVLALGASAVLLANLKPV